MHETLGTNLQNHPLGVWGANNLIATLLGRHGGKNVELNSATLAEFS